MLAQGWLHLGGRRLVYLSTLLDPAASTYASYKRLGELWISQREGGRILRLGSVYGGPARNDGVVSRFIDAVLQGRDVNIHGDGTQRIALVHMRDVVEAVLRAVDSRSPQTPRLVQVVDGWVSVVELLDMIEMLAGRRAARVYQPEAGPLARRRYMLDSALPRHLSTDPAHLRVDLRSGLTCAIREAQARAPGVTRS